MRAAHSRADRSQGQQRKVKARARRQQTAQAGARGTAGMALTMPTDCCTTERPEFRFPPEAPPPLLPLRHPPRPPPRPPRPLRIVCVPTGGLGGGQRGFLLATLPATSPGPLD
jgi:hypothetical protein